ncbi:MAG: YdcF family protein, partial [Propionibacteriaceae bacterium]|nr:YdcF family protein [Propionibacteriaceae bacterium]
MWLFTVGWLAIFAFSLWRDPRKLRNGVYLMAALTAAGFSLFWYLVQGLRQASRDNTIYLLLAGAAAVVLVALVLGVMLVLNGITMLRREGRRLANLLSLGLGLAILGYLTLGFSGLSDPTARILAWTLAIGLPIGYLGFCFLAYVLYSGLYQCWTRRHGRPASAVVVLGSGLIDGRVTPLLASRLDRGQAIWRRSLDQGGCPVLVVSGGQGPDEPRPEADAMAEYLVEHGVEPELIWREDTSRTTEQNINQTKIILRKHGVSGPVAVVTNNFHAFRAA